MMKINIILLSFVSFLLIQVFSTTNVDGQNGKISIETFEPIIKNKNFQMLPNQENVHTSHSIPFLPKDLTSYSLVKKDAELTHPLKTFPTRAPNVATPNGQINLVNIFSGFEGHDETQFDGNPPDVSIAAGPNHLVETVNLSIDVFTKQGTMVSNSFLDSFLHVSNLDFISDPKVLYDSLSGRWFVSLLDVSTHSVVLAVSKTSDPSDLVNGWFFYNIAFSNCPDQPKIGVSNDKFVISGNDFSNGCVPPFVGAEYLILDKSQLISGSSVNSQRVGPDVTSFSLTPAQDLSSTSTLYLAENLDTKVRLYSISGSVPSVSISHFDNTMQTSSIPPSASQPGTSIQIDTGDTRIQDAKWYQGKLWLAFNDGCTPSGDTQSRSCIHLVQINTGSSTVSQDFRISSSGYSYFYPAVGIDSSGGLDLVFGFSSVPAVQYPGIAISGQSISDTINTIRPLQTLKGGSTPDINPVESGFPGTRYGDYFGAALDPSDMTQVWVAGEYQTLPPSLFSKSPWSTFIGSTSLSLTESVSLSNSIGISDQMSTTSTRVKSVSLSESLGISDTTTGTGHFLQQSYITDLLTVYNSRSDLQSAFPEVAHGSYNNLFTWAATHGVLEDPQLLQKHVSVYDAMYVWNLRPDLQTAFPEAANGATLTRLLSWAGSNGITEDSTILAFHAALYQLMTEYLQRPDLQSAFPEAANGDSMGNLFTWAATHGVLEDPQLQNHAPVYDAMYVWNIRLDLQSAFPEAANSATLTRLLSWAGSNGITEMPTILASHTALYHLMYAYSLRPDVATAFPEAANGDNMGNLFTWTANHGITEMPTILGLPSDVAIYKLMYVYAIRSDLQSAFPEAANTGNLAHLFGWANVQGFIEESAILGTNTGQYATPPPFP